MARGARERCPTIYASGRRAIDKDARSRRWLFGASNAGARGEHQVGVIVGFMFWGRTACGTLLGAYLSALRTLVERSR